jgi:hypothetical protein
MLRRMSLSMIWMSFSISVTFLAIVAKWSSVAKSNLSVESISVFKIYGRVSMFSCSRIEVLYIRLRANEDHTATSPSSIGFNVLLAKGQIVSNAVNLCDNYSHLAALQIVVCRVFSEVVDISSPRNIGNDDLLLEDGRLQEYPAACQSNRLG